MQPLSRIAGAVMAIAGVAVMSAVPAAAKCTSLAFSVNDYGKDGPTADAKALLDKHIAKWAADNKITKYNVGKKDVSCELFLNFIVFDEHTCKASATVCFTDPPGGVKLPPEALLPDKPAAKKDKPAQSVRAGTPVVTRKAVTETGAVPAAKAEPVKAPATAPVAAPAPAAAPVAPAPDKAAEAAAAAEKAAAAAERAAAAAERAAAAAAKTPAAVAPAAAPAVATPKVAQ